MALQDLSFKAKLHPLYNLLFKMENPDKPVAVTLEVNKKVGVQNNTSKTISLNDEGIIKPNTGSSFGVDGETTYLSTITYGGKKYKSYQTLHGNPDEDGFKILENTVKDPVELFVSWGDSIFTGFVSFEPEHTD